MTYPDVFVIGAPKTGTTSIAAMLRVTPGVFVPEVKEPHYFGKDIPLPHADYVRNLDDYLWLYRRAEGFKVAVDASVWYYRSRSAAYEIKKVCPDAKIIFVARRPSELVESLYFHKLFGGDEKVQNPRDAIFRKREVDASQVRWTTWGLDYLGVARWKGYLPAWQDLFADNFMILFHEELVENIADAYARVCRFIDVSPVVDALRDSHKNSSKKNRSLPVQRLVSLVPLSVKQSLHGAWWFGPLLDTFWALFPARRAQRMRLAFDSSLRRDIAREFLPHTEYLEELTGRDLTSWKS